MSLFRKRAERDVDRWVVLGLGNPGAKYAGNRHNIGAVVIEELASERSLTFKTHKSGCLVAESGSLVLARPTSYMNESGRPTASLMRFYKAPLERLVVVHDELDISFGDLRIKVGGGVAGHNGLRSLAEHLGSRDFVRVRFGISRPPGQRDAAAHVLSDFTRAEREDLPRLIERAVLAVEKIVEHGTDRAMNEINTKLG